MAIQAIGAEQLKSEGIKEFSDYARKISGLAFEDQGPGDKKIVLRGLDSTGAAHNRCLFRRRGHHGQQPAGWRRPPADIQLIDMERIEVLKGPQGSLYGASSMAGTVRMLTNKPDPTRVYAAFDAGTGSTEGAHGANYNYDGTLNVPIVQDKLAVRAVGYASDRKGYIDNRQLGIDGVNNDKIAGGRVSARWLITDDATLDAMYLHQTSHQHHRHGVVPADLRTFNQANNSPSPWAESLDAYNAALNWKVAKAP